MKKIWLFIFLIMMGFLTQAQRFFYLAGSHHGDKILEDRLRKSAQFIAKTPLVSDYIINTDFEYLTGQDVLEMKLDVKDSVTFETIFQASESYSFGVLNNNRPIGLNLAMEAFLERNIGRLIFSTKTNHYNGLMKYLKPRKDKT